LHLIGDRLGLYRPLACARGLTPAELAAAGGVSERYARDWLEQQTVSGILETINPDADDDARRYRLPAGHDEALTDESSLAFIAPLAQSVAGVTPALDLLLDALRTGEGVPYEAYGRDASESQARSTRPLYNNGLRTLRAPAGRREALALLPTTVIVTAPTTLRGPLAEIASAIE
jgi:hypothetical protein